MPGPSQDASAATKATQTARRAESASTRIMSLGPQVGAAPASTWPVSLSAAASESVESSAPATPTPRW